MIVRDATKHLGEELVRHRKSSKPLRSCMSSRQRESASRSGGAVYRWRPRHLIEQRLRVSQKHRVERLSARSALAGYGAHAAQVAATLQTT